MSDPTPLVMIVTGEFSGNIYGAQVAECLRRAAPAVRLVGVGCSDMQEAGVELLYDCSSWGAVGLVEAFKRPQLLWVFYRLRRWIAAHRPAVLVLIDYPGFNMALANYARGLGIPTVYFFPPGKHTTKPETVAATARQITRVAAPLPTTFHLYKSAGARVEFVGHPLIDAMEKVPGRDEARRLLGVPPEARLVGLLPGSRLQEIRSHTPDLIEVARGLRARFPDMRFLLPKVTLQREFLERKIDGLLEPVRRSGLPIDIVQGRSQCVMAASDALVVASGTATLEAAYLAIPMVIVYRVSWLTEILANLFYKRFPRFIGLPNILADREIVPELIQQRFTPEETVHQVGRFFDDARHRERVVADLLALRRSLGGPGAAARVARMVLEEGGLAATAALAHSAPLADPAEDPGPGPA